MTTTNDAPAPAPSGSGVRVKPLEWIEQGLSINSTWRADSSFGRYLVYMRPNNSWAFEPPGLFGGRVGFKSPNEAMTAAQADYEARILSALASDASPSGEAVAWRLIDSEGDHWWGPSCSKEQFDKAARENPDLIGQPLYAYPAPATVEMREAAELLAHLKRIPMIEWVWSDAEWIFRVLAALAPATEGRRDNGIFCGIR